MAQKGFRRKPHPYRNPRALMFNLRTDRVLADDENAPEPPSWTWNGEPEEMDGEEE